MEYSIDRIYTTAERKINSVLRQIVPSYHHSGDITDPVNDTMDNDNTSSSNYDHSHDESNLLDTSTTSLSSIFQDEHSEEDQVPSENMKIKLDNIIHILKDDCSVHVDLQLKSKHDKKDNMKIENVPVKNNLPKLIKPNVNYKDEKQSVPRMDWNNYHRLDVIQSFMDDLEYDYPSICTTGAIGKSLEGRDLKILRISNSDVTNKSVWIDAGIHAREWIAPAVATYIADHIARNFNDMPTSVSNKDWYFLPVVNPDGYEYSHTTDRMWRKNRARHAGECVGVDLNRNFSFGWGGKGSSGVPTSVFYRGPQPFSEPESSAIRNFLMNAGISFEVYITLHSFGQVIIFPFAYKEELCPDYVRLLEGATVMSKAINECNGNIYKVGISKDVMYGAAGTSYDFSYGTAQIPFCYLIELRSKEHKFKLPKEEIEETGNEILNCIKALVQFIDEKYPSIT